MNARQELPPIVVTTQDHRRLMRTARVAIEAIGPRVVGTLEPVGTTAPDRRWH